MYYGQWETDKIIESYFKEQNTGFCIEVGAYDGVKGSNTKLFNDKGWNTMCIEPNPFVFEELQKNRPNSICINAACDRFIGTAGLEIFNFKSGIQSSLTSLDTDVRLIEDYEQAIINREIVTTQVVTLNHILSSNNITNIDFISIDTEGTEIKVLQGINLDKFKPTLLVVENNYNDTNIPDYLDDYGYIKVIRYKINDFYMRDNRD